METHAPVMELYTREVPSAEAVTNLLPVALKLTAFQFMYLCVCVCMYVREYVRL